MLPRLARPVLLAQMLLATGCTALAGVEEWPEGIAAGGASSGSGSAGSGGGGNSGGEGGTPTCSSPAGAPPYVAAVLADCPVGYWRLGETSGPDAIDASGYHEDGVYEAGTEYGVDGALDGDPDTAVALTAAAGLVDVGDNFDFPRAAAFSIEVWVNPAFAPQNYARIVTKENSIPEEREGYSLVFHESAVSFERWRVNQDDTVLPYVQIDAGVYTHIVATFDSVVMTLYLDGKLRASLASETELPNVRQHFIIGATAMPDHRFAGSIDEVAVYPLALSAADVLAHYTVARPD